MPCHIALTPDALSLDRASRLLEDPAAGAAILFCGRVRHRNAGKDVAGIRYEAYAAMAHTECERIWAAVERRWPVARGVIWHRTGDLVVGEISVIVGVAAVHRATAFAAARYIIDTLKADVPIWKEEAYAGGARGWITGTP